MSARDLLRLAPEVTAAEVWPVPLPLYRDPERPVPFPLEALGPLEAVVRETLRVVQAPDALVAASYLAAASMAAQGLANVVLDGRVYPLSLYALTVAESGERKTAVDAIATRPVREAQERLHLSQLEEVTVWEGQVGAWEAERKRIMADKQSTREAREAALEELGPPPPRPWYGLMLTSEPTYEGLVKLLADGWPAAGLISSEGGSFLGGHAMSKDHRLRTIAGLSELWDGRPIDRVRAGDGMSLLLNRRLALHLLAQPIVARELLGDPLAQGQGLLARMLTAAPTSTAGSRRYIPEAVEDTAEYEIYRAKITFALDHVERLVLSDSETRKRGLTLRNLPLAPSAKRLWIGFYEHVESHLNTELAPIRALAAKLAEHALRMAGVLALHANPEAAGIGEEPMRMSVELAQWYGAEALRLAGGYRIPRELALAGEVLSWIHERTAGRTPRLVHLAEVYQFGPAGVRSARAAREVLRVLEEHNYLAHRPNAEVEGQARRDAWEVNPRI